MVLPDSELAETAAVRHGWQTDFGCAENRSRYGDIYRDRGNSRHIALKKHLAKELYTDNPGAYMPLCIAAFVDEFSKNGDFLIFAICNRNKWCYIIRTQSGGCSSVG